ncbi:MAG: cysteine--tRNA ligase [Polyangiaceae bacterium]|jgi:cysteinyl-tRNA synthetase
MPARAINLYNTMTQRLEPLDPAEPGHVRLYVCGPTTYDHVHAGHARTFIAFDVLVRFLRASGYRVTFVRNMTDVDDKILQRAQQNGEPPLSFSKRMAAINAEELRACGCIEPDFEPRVSQNIERIVALVESLIAKDRAYVASTAKGNDVYFAVRAFPSYGKLSHRVLDELLAGARVEPGEAKRDPLDFAVWKAASSDELGWASPWGHGRPGWHIECSAMAERHLSAHFDIHGGGMDLIFPHHENEIAQSEAAWGAPFARLWMHSGFLTVDAEKMGKSLGNFVTVAQILERNDSEALRYFVLGAHYHGPLNFDLEHRADGRILFPGLDEAERRVDYLYATSEALAAAAVGVAPSLEGADDDQAGTLRHAPARVLEALGADLNTSVALSVVGDVAKVGNDIVQQVAKARRDPNALARARSLAAAALETLGKTVGPLGLLQASCVDFIGRTRKRRLKVRGLSEAAIEARVSERNAARAAKDFARADRIRSELSELGVELKDSPGASAAGATTSWRICV